MSVNPLFDVAFPLLLKTGSDLMKEPQKQVPDHQPKPQPIRLNLIREYGKQNNIQNTGSGTVVSSETHYHSDVHHHYHHHHYHHHHYYCLNCQSSFTAEPSKSAQPQTVENSSLNPAGKTQAYKFGGRFSPPDKHIGAEGESSPNSRVGLRQQGTSLGKFPGLQNRRGF
jgi:hypothetical protein